MERVHYFTVSKRIRIKLNKKIKIITTAFYIIYIKLYGYGYSGYSYNQRSVKISKKLKTDKCFLI